jgi:4-amino-4-deoxy-L-arabinose transferase-like glycosyltransferase
VTLVASKPAAGPEPAGRRHEDLLMPQSWPRTPIAERVAFCVLLASTGLLYLWNLSSSGWANSFYSAAVQAGANSWTAMLFGSSDAANAITVDKTPAALWVMDFSARIFGVHSWSVLVPQALEGVAAVALLYAAVRRVSGPSGALLAGTILALTPVATLMFRFNNPDALLTLLLVAAAYCVQRACERDSGGWWLPLAGVAVGFGFLAKMLQAFLVLPGFAVVFLVAAHPRLRKRIRGVLAAGAAVVISGGWYLALVELWPAAARPYIGGSQHNSIIELALGYNGFGRLTGDETGGLGNMNRDVGWGRLFGREMGNEISWLIPAAVICIAAGFWITRRASRTDPTRAALLLWSSWLAATAAVLSYMNGIVHPYYTVAVAPAIAAGIGVGAPLLWRRRHDMVAAVALSGAVLVTTVLAGVLLARHAAWLSWLSPTIAVAGVGAAVLLLVVGRLNDVAARAVASIAVVAGLAGPAAYSLATAASPHGGAIPGSGPTLRGGLPAGMPTFGGLLGSPEPGPRLLTALTADAGAYTWTAATIGSNNAAGYQLASRQPVMAVGGFNGTDPSPTLEVFKRYVTGKQIHYFLGGKLMGAWGGSSGGSHDATLITDWVVSNFPKQKIDGIAVYDLTA